MSSVKFNEYYNIVNGQQRGAPTSHKGVNPSTGEELWDVPTATEQDLNDAVAAAKEAFKTWSKTPEGERFAKMHEFLKLYKAHEADFIDLLSKETGKPRGFATQEVQLTTGWLEYPNTIKLPVDVEEDDQKIIKTTYKPLGVIGAICPWNFPMLLGAGKLGPALATGNTIVIKPSPFSPYTMIKLVELMNQVYPPGVVSVLSGGDDLGPAMTTHPDIAKITFTGSTGAGKKIMAACAGTLKRLTLELGGNDVAIVMPDADIDRVAPEVALAAFMVSGQVCVATKRIYAHESIYEPFLSKLKQAVNRLVVGKQNDDGVILGPVQNKPQFDRVLKFFEHAKDNGLDFATGGPTSYEQSGKGYFIQPTLIANPPDSSMIVQEEAFGPIVPVLKWSSEDDVVARANDSQTGLGGSVWGTDIEKAEALADRIETGTVWINSLGMVNPAVYFPPQKQSGVGGEWGKAGKLAYCNAQVKHIWKEMPTPAKAMGLAA